MKRAATWLATAAAVALMGGFASSPAAAVDEPLVIANQLVQKWVDALNKKDAATLDSLYAKDAILMPMGEAQPVKGAPDIRKFFDAYLQRPAIDNLKITRSELILVGPRAMAAAGTWSADTPAPNGADPQHIMGTYLSVIAQNDGGQWQVIAETWNRVPLPAAEQPTAAAPEPAPQPQSGTSTPDK